MIAFLRNLVFHDFWLKLFSLGLAGLVWFTVNTMMGSKTPVPSLPGPMQEITFDRLPVVVLSSAANVRSFQVNPKEVTVTVRGERKTIEKLQKNDIRVLVDLTGVEAARDLQSRIEVLTPPGVSLIRSEPQEVHVLFPSKTE